MTALAIPHPMTVREVDVATRLVVADASRFLVDVRRASLRDVAKRWVAARFVALVDARLVLPVLRAETPEAMHRELDARIPSALRALRVASVPALLTGLLGAGAVDRASGSWERILERLDERDLERLDPEAVARLRVALAGHALAYHDLQLALRRPEVVCDPTAFQRGTEAMAEALVPLFVLLAWTLDVAPVRADVLEALAERVEREADAVSVLFARALATDEAG